MSFSEMYSPGSVVEHRWTYDRPVKVELVRGAKGIYRWTITYRGHDADEVLEQLKGVDWALFQHFVVVPREVEGGDIGDTTPGHPRAGGSD